MNHAPFRYRARVAFCHGADDDALADYRERLLVALTDSRLDLAQILG
ncbi:MAG: hypothetical protein JNJ46_30300 [Myxococcales bacterium]|nr:hypothetical protein [Myxococcales bacterium]